MKKTVIIPTVALVIVLGLLLFAMKDTPVEPESVEMDIVIEEVVEEEVE